MKKVLAAVLALALMLSVSVCAFAADDMKDVSSVPMPKDVSVDPAEINLGALIDLPDALKAEAEKQAARIRNSGYMILSGFGVWSDAGTKTFCTVKLGVEEVPKDAKIFVNGQAILPETGKDDEAHFYFDVPLDAKLTKSVVLIAIREEQGKDEAEPYYPSPNAAQP